MLLPRSVIVRLIQALINSLILRKVFNERREIVNHLEKIWIDFYYNSRTSSYCIFDEERIPSLPNENDLVNFSCVPIDSPFRWEEETSSYGKLSSV